MNGGGGGGAAAVYVCVCLGGGGGGGWALLLRRVFSKSLQLPSRLSNKPFPNSLLHSRLELIIPVSCKT